MAAILATQSMATAAWGPVELKWSELGPRIKGHNVELMLPDGVLLKGEVKAVREEALVLNVRRTSNSQAYPKGNAVIPRTSVSELSLKESRGKWGRSVGVSLGGLTGAAGGYAATTYANSGPDSAAAFLATFLVITGAGALAGYFLGRSADTRVTHIRVVQ
jgi:hypothetical protein